jgi:hypothetical protein
VAEVPVAQPNGHPMEPVSQPVDQPVNGDMPPLLVVPTEGGLPCAGVAIADLKPAQLAMLISKTARLVQDQGGRWVPLLYALQAERTARLDRDQRRKGTPATVTIVTGEADVPDVPPPAAVTTTGEG